MILLPYGHEQTSVRRLPWVTLSILAACVLGFVFSGRFSPVPAEDRRIEEQVRATLEYWGEHPYLRLPDEFRTLFLAPALDPEQEQALGFRTHFEAAKPPLAELRAEQDEITARAGRAVASYQAHSLRRFGLVPTGGHAIGWLTHMFLHGGWLHLLGNMLILYLAAPFVEDVWGRPLFASVYLVAGFVAGLFHTLSNLHSSVPMIGASGAIAGVMGAFLVRHGTTRIKFFYLFLLARGTFEAPAWVMIPLWFLSQLWMGFLTSQLDVGTGVAHWAHVGGFLTGVGLAWLVRAQRIEERFVEPVIQREITLEVPGAQDVVKALVVRDTDPERAFRMLSLSVMNRPESADAAGALWDLAQQLGRVAEVAPLMLRAIAHQLRSGDADLALDQWGKLARLVPELEGDPREFLRLAQALVERDRREEALIPLHRALHQGGEALEPNLALSIARLAREFAPSIAREAAQQALAASAEPEIRRRAQELLESQSVGPQRSIPLS